MAIVSRRAATFMFVATLSLGLSHAGGAQAETKGGPPSADAVRIPGFWDLQGNLATAPRAGWVWVPSRWIVPPFRGARWDPAHWGWRDDWYSWIPGHWVASRDAVEAVGA